jgi:hypothetical protein
MSIVRPSFSIVVVTFVNRSPQDEARYVVDPETFIARHFAAVPQLLAIQGGPQPPPTDMNGAEVVGAFLPGTDVWLGLDARLLGDSTTPWEERIGAREDFIDNSVRELDERVSVGRDGHVLQLSAQLAQTNEDH